MRTTRRAFTVVEVLVAVSITALLAGFLVATLTNVSGFWSRTSGKLSAEAQGRYVLDQLTLDLQGALYRDDGNTWLAATVLGNTTNTGLWNTTGATANALKPNNTGGSLLRPSSGNLADARFGQGGTWLRFFTTKRATNPASANATTTATSTSAPVAVAYQIVRRATTATATNLDRRYLLHRSEVRPAAIPGQAARNGTLQAGFHITASAYQPASGSAQAADPAEIKFPTLNSVIAENVIDFGVRMYVYAPNATTEAMELRTIFPSSDSDTAHAATLPPRVQNASNNFNDCFPEVVDVMVRVLTDEGARLIAAYEANPQRVTTPTGRNAQEFWWDLALANSQVFTRRIVLAPKPL